MVKIPNRCLKCKRHSVSINSMQLCGRCFPLERIPSSVIDSGNENIDNFIKSSQSQKYRSLTNTFFLEWVPHENLTDIECIGMGGFSKIYKATWEKSPPYLDGCVDATKRVKTEVALKVLNNSQSVDEEFWNEVTTDNVYESYFFY